MDGAPLSVPFYVLDSPAFSTLAVGDQHACAITAAGGAFCWGANESGQLGNGTAARSAQPVAVTGEHTFTAISPGAAHTCALAADSTAWCWGDNRAGQLGSGSMSALAMTIPVAVTGGMKFTAIGAGAAYTCALAAGGAAYCWGDNAFGRLGIGFNDSSAAPVAVAGALRFTALSAELGGPCAIASDGHAYCWGSHHGVSGTEPSSVARQLSFASISAGEDHDCGIATDGMAYCWGTNWYGQLGDGTEVTSAVPVRVVGQR
jgi:alpha-tubulin suppressor-like RCC1 family protein